MLIREPLTVVLAEQRRRAGEPIAPAGGELRDHGVGAQILIDLGVREMVLLTHSNKSIVGIEGFGLKIVGQKPVPGSTLRRLADAHVDAYRRTPTARPAVDGVKGARILIVEIALLPRDRRRADRGRRARDRQERRGSSSASSCRVPSRSRAPSRWPPTTMTASSRWAASSAARPPTTTMSAARARAA